MTLFDTDRQVSLVPDRGIQTTSLGDMYAKFYFITLIHKPQIQVFDQYTN